MTRLLPAIGLMLLLGLAPTHGLAVTIISEITFAPSGNNTDGQGPTSTDPADGNRVVVQATSAVSTGRINQRDLSSLSISLFGTNGLIFSDLVILGGQPTELGGLQRGFQDIRYIFDFDIFVSAPEDGLRRFDNDRLVISTGSDQDTYNIFFDNVGGFRFIDAVLYESGTINLALSVVNDNGFSITTTVVPLPASVMFLLAGLGAFSALRYRRRARLEVA
ncbi:MAG: VPLPA-CTERM sorting domain-containing protein [Pseudomonadota bacterium]